MYTAKKTVRVVLFPRWPNRESTRRSKPGTKIANSPRITQNRIIAIISGLVCP